MPYGHAESNDLLRNRERSIRFAKSYATEFGKNIKMRICQGQFFSVNQESQTFLCVWNVNERATVTKSFEFRKGDQGIISLEQLLKLF